MDDYYISVDFVYNNTNGPVLVFCDGSVHDESIVQVEDEHKRKLLKDAGYDVLVWHYRTPIEEFINTRKDIFRKQG